MALFHLSVTQTKRSAGQSAIASAAYRAGERLYSEYYGEYSDYTRKGGVICSDILLPSHAPPEYADRQTLWNAVEKAERGKNAQLAYSFDIALQNEFSLEENIALARQFLLETFLRKLGVAHFSPCLPPVFQRFGTAPVGSGNGVEHKLSVCVPDTVAVLVQLIHPALL